jgi:acetyl esterase/lipase
MRKQVLFAVLASLGVLLGLAPPSQEQQHPAGRSARAAASLSDTQEITIQENIPYESVNGTDVRLDVFEPAHTGSGATFPAVVLIHGGGWTSFDKSTMRRMGEFLARSGFAAFSVDYRLFQGSENRWPAQLDDVQRAVRWIRANASKYSVNPERIGSFGHSAGAQLAALLGMEDTRDNSDASLAPYSSRVEAVVDVSGPTDFTTDRHADSDNFMASFLGVPYSQDPAVWRNASPAFHVSKSDAPFLIMHGTQDDNVPIAQAQELYDKLRSVNVPVTFIKVDDAHTFRRPQARERLATETLSFFNRYLAK